MMVSDVTTETEIKLQVAPETLHRVRRHALVHDLKQGRPVTGTLKSVYFDTEDHSLHRREMVLRVRHIGRRRIQTLKTNGAAMNGGLGRGEWENEISGDQPELLALRSAAPEQPLGDERWARGLRPLFATEVKRTVYRLAGVDWEVELALDEGRVVSATGSAPIAEIELELKRGQPRVLFDLARRLQTGMSARLSITSKSERGYNLVSGKALAPRKARDPAIPPAATTGEACRAILRSCADQLLANQDCLFETGDREAVHQMRVAMRRLSSALKLLGPALDTPETAALSEEMRWVRRFLGPARDSDVFLHEIVEPLTEQLAAEPGFQILRDIFAEQRSAAFDTALAALSTPRFTQFLLALGAWIEGGDWLSPDDEDRRWMIERPARATATEILRHRDHVVRKAGRRLAELDAHGRHRVRIKMKRLRYAAEFFASLYPGVKSKRLAKSMSRLQDDLGHLNDIAVAANRLRAEGERRGDPARLWVAGQIAGWHAARVPRLLEAAEEDYRSFEKSTRFWEEED